MVMGPRQCCCAACPNGWPSMYLTVTGASGSISWAGESWTLPADSGVQKEVCPTNYILQKIGQGTTVSGSTYWASATHSWGYVVGLVNQMGMIRRQQVYAATTSGVYMYDVRNALVIGPGGSVAEDRKRFFGDPATPPKPFLESASSTVVSDLSMILGVAHPTAFGAPSTYVGSYQLTAPFFGSHTISGITYTWAKGNNWP